MRWRRKAGDTTARFRVCSSPFIELSVRPVAGSVVREYEAAEGKVSSSRSASRRAS
jgi:hypothetical protein